jgi:hypothetical protein
MRHRQAGVGKHPLRTYGHHHRPIKLSDDVAGAPDKTIRSSDTCMYVEPTYLVLLRRPRQLCHRPLPMETPGKVTVCRRRRPDQLGDGPRAL